MLHWTLSSLFSPSRCVAIGFVLALTMPSPATAGTARVAACVPQGVGTVVQPMSCANRTSGVAPLAVTFDAIGSASGVVQPAPGQAATAFHHAWDFGDLLAGSWFPTRKSKNAAIGFVATHVYERPGTYTVTLNLTDPFGNERQYQQVVQVFDPDVVYAGATFYVSSTLGNDSNNGLSAATPFRTLPHACSVLFAANGPRRLLLRGGDTFPVGSTIYAPTCTGPYTIATYGGRARVDFAGLGDGLAAYFVQDLRIVDIDLVGPTSGSTGAAFQPGGSCLALRVGLRRFRYGSGIFWGSNHDDNTWQECSLISNGQYGLYAIGVRHLAVLGCVFHDSVTNSLFRSYASRSVVHANVFARAGLSPIRFLGGPQQSPSGHVAMTDNIVVSNSPWVLEIGPESSTTAQFIDHVLIERNHFFCRGSQSVVLVFGDHVAVRNNVFDANGNWAVAAFQRGIGPVPRGLTVDNNTAYRSGSQMQFVTAQTLDPTMVRNNIVWSGGGPISLAVGNVATANNLTTNPMFMSPASGDFRVQSGSPAIDAGLNGITRQDYLGVRRPSSAADIGAFEY